MTIRDIINAFIRLADDITKNMDSTDYQKIISLAQQNNPWFEKSQIINALNNIGYYIKDMVKSPDSVKEITPYLNNEIKLPTLHILIVCAGNIPAVAFHDVMCVILSGNKASIKLSSNDNIIIPFLLERLIHYLPELKSHIELSTTLSDIKYSSCNGVIATGSNSSSLIFEEYFQNIPHIIRKNRYSCAIIQNNDDISGLEDDICLYFGQGCRSISHLFVPNNYDWDMLFKKLKKYSYFTNHNKFRNNLDYQKAIMIMNNIPFIEASPILLRENNELYSPISVVNYSYYNDIRAIENIIHSEQNNLQCIATSESLSPISDCVCCCLFGQTQRPKFTDYADNINTLQWLCSL